VKAERFWPWFCCGARSCTCSCNTPAKSAADARRALDTLTKQAQPGWFSNHLGRSYLFLGRSLKAQGNQTEPAEMFRLAAEHLSNSLGSGNPETVQALRLAGK